MLKRLPDGIYSYNITIII